MQREKQIYCKDCYIGDIFRLDVNCPFVDYYIKDHGRRKIEITENDEVLIKIIKKNKTPAGEGMELAVYINRVPYITHYGYWLADKANIPANDIRFNLSFKMKVDEEESVLLRDEKENGIYYKDCHVGDVFRLDNNSPLVQYCVMDDGIEVTEKDEVTATITKIDRWVVVDIALNGELYYESACLEDDSEYPEDNIQLNLKTTNIIKKKNNYY